MSTLGEKVTKTIAEAAAGAISKSLLDQDADVKNLISGMVDKVLADPKLPPETRKLFEAANHESTVTDLLVKMLYLALGLIPGLWRVMQPGAQAMENVAWYGLPSRLVPPQLLIPAYFRWSVPEDQLYQAMRANGYDTEPTLNMINATRRILEPDEIRDLALRKGWSDDVIYKEMHRHGYSDGNINALKELWNSNLLDPRDIITGWRLNIFDRVTRNNLMAQHGYSETMCNYLAGATMRPLDLDSVREATLRNILKDFGPQIHLDKLGYSGEDSSIIKQLWWRLPNVQDLIRMAVREVFTPDIAAKFGQFDDFPGPFGSWAKQLGIGDYWAKNYWGAHWDLPSATQGFEMFHRSIINADELAMLLRALDVMPFWRDKLIQMSYNIPTRVDIRRMYQIGIYTRDDVKATYQKGGYSPEDAEALTEFTVQYYGADEETSLDEEQDFTKTEVLSAYRSQMITRPEASTYLKELMYTDAQITFYLNREDLKLSQEVRDAYLSGYKALFVAGQIGADKVQADLEKVGISRAETAQQLTLWQLERTLKADRPTRAQLDTFLQEGVIDVNTWTQEMKELGWSDRYIVWWLQINKKKIQEAQ